MYSLKCASCTRRHGGATWKDTSHSEDPHAAVLPHLVLGEEEGKQHQQPSIIWGGGGLRTDTQTLLSLLGVYFTIHNIESLLMSSYLGVYYYITI